MPASEHKLEEHKERALEEERLEHRGVLQAVDSSSETAKAERPRSTGNRGGLLRRVGLVLLLLAAGAFAYWRIKSNQREENVTTARTVAAANRAVPVTVAAVETRTMPIYLTALGTVTAYNMVTIKSRVDGQLLSVNVREGQQVRKGQVLATIDSRPYEAAVAQAEGQLAKDEAAATNSRAEAGRYTALFQAGVVSKESEQVQISTAGQSVGTLQADKAAIQAAKVNVGYTRITSPIDGVVGLRQVDAGNIVHAADANGLLLVTQLQPIAVIFTLPEDQLPAVLKLVRDGQKLSVEAFDRSETTRLATGTLLTVDNQIDTTTGTVKAKAVFPNADGALFPNQFVNVRLILEQRQNSLIIPAAGLQSGTNGTFVYTVKAGAPPRTADEESGVKTTPDPNAGKAGRSGAAEAGGSGDGQKPGPLYYVDVQPVTVDLTEGSQIILRDGVQVGDQIVIDGQEKLRRYSKVDPRAGRSGGGGAGMQAAGMQGAGMQGAGVQGAGSQGTGSQGTGSQPGRSQNGRAGSPSEHSGSRTGTQGGGRP